MAVGDFYRVSVLYNHPNADGQVVNVFDYEQTVIDTPKTEPQFCLELAAEVIGVTVANFMPNITASWELAGAECFNITQPTFQGTVSSGVNGGVTGESVALRSAVVCSKKTGLRGRSFQGRSFLVAPPEVDQNAGLISGSYFVVMGDYCDALIELVLVNDNEYKLVVFSELLQIGTQVQTFIPSLTLGSVRGRQKVV